MIRRMSRSLAPVRVVLPNSSTPHSGTVIFFHGSGNTGDDCCEDVEYVLKRKFAFPHLKVLFPTAPLQPYTPLYGYLSHVWFDRLAISQSVPECIESIESIQESVKDLIRQENNDGIPNSRILVGGISMGGALALYTGLRWQTSVAGIFALSSFLNDDSIVYKYLDESKTSTPELLQFHGEKDDLVPLKSAKSTFNKLVSLGVSGKFLVDEYGEHMPNTSQLDKVYSWIQEKLPPL